MINLYFQEVVEFPRRLVTQKCFELIWVKLIVLFQVIFVLKSFYRVPKEQIVDGMKNILKFRGIHIKEKKVVLRTLELWLNNNVEIVDCYLIACLEGDTQNLLYSYDRDFAIHQSRSAFEQHTMDVPHFRLFGGTELKNSG